MNHQELLEAAIDKLRQASFQSHNGHFDMTRQGGRGCPECIRARKLRDQAEELLCAWREARGN